MWLKRFATHSSGYAALNRMTDIPTPTILDQLVFTDIQSLSSRRKLLDKIIMEWTHEVREDDLEFVLRYTNSKGVVTNKMFFSVLMHFFNHQTHHRGQATTLLWQSDVDIGITDLIALIPEEMSAM